MVAAAVAAVGQAIPAVAEGTRSNVRTDNVDFGDDDGGVNDMVGMLQPRLPLTDEE